MIITGRILNKVNQYMGDDLVTNLTLQDEILNTLADDGESIIQIEQQLIYFKVPFTREIIKANLNEMLDKSLIYIAYPESVSIGHFKSLLWELKEVESFWFELTTQGRKCLENIKF